MFGKKKFSWREKLDYYRQRSLDRTLTQGQRDYANSFLNGFDEVDTYNKKHGLESIKSHQIYAKQSKELIELNKRYGGDVASFAGNAAAHEKAIDILEKK